LLEEGLWDRSTELEALGLRPVLSTDSGFFGGGQAILVEDEVLVGSSDRHKDGYVAGLLAHFARRVSSNRETEGPDEMEIDGA
jgi:hypothetical protein